MAHYRPRAALATHEVTNQPPPFEDVNIFELDAALREAVEKAGGGAHAPHLSAFGGRVGSAEVIEWGVQANRNPPQLKSFDRYGHRLDEVEFHPAYHELMDLGISAGVAAGAWRASEAGHVLHAALLYMMGQADGGVCCPMSMTYAVVPALRREPAVAAEWEPRVTAGRYDPRFIPAREKRGATMGMAMTEKQGGSDVRANTTRAEKTGADEYLLTGHKWFCSAPMCDAFLTLAQTEAGLACFLVPRWKPDGTRNAFHIMRLKDKLGDRSNASSEIEYHGAWARRVGEEGRGVRTIIEMVNHTRLDCVVGSAGGMRAALAQALWHAAHRTAFQKKLIDQPAMRGVLADLALETEAATALAVRLARAFDHAGADESEAAFARLATPVAKYWICKRHPGVAYEAMECLGGAGYVEESPMPRLYRAAPLNAIWEGSGNVIALDILRALGREPASREALMAELSRAKGANRLYDAHLARLGAWFEPGALGEAAARGFAETLALALQAAALHQYAPDFVFDGFCAGRLDPDSRALLYGAAPGVDADRMIARALPV
ncbi:acyl-CoA dehydrogenase family protein [Amphiplicatus metriothermophilus]|uniref:Putative acyl-CoA dehydrogenase n=1 Tax=Amphiplicatus metriothermophilus TaxID=1519374 RepID=A0A239PXW0_9PROT|nr:acyl-CoA dehydrogenase family protein [Amphiplicatus metriothermophilus]MBB5519893.1 putative acyl-CoA dehydrogenase [Amphiplicatus metriothermophilus]SNT74796.1 putative acyl-CoA dehydrogenase [Amphiplicatus metriothermophilus]